MNPRAGFLRRPPGFQDFSVKWTWVDFSGKWLPVYVNDFAIHYDARCACCFRGFLREQMGFNKNVYHSTCIPSCNVLCVKSSCKESSQTICCNSYKKRCAKRHLRFRHHSFGKQSSNINCFSADGSAKAVLNGCKFVASWF